MNAPANLARPLIEHLPPDLLYFLRKAGELTQKQQQRLYLVGGAVRDVLLERPTLDIDLVVEGDALKMAQDLARINSAKVTTHPRFGTASLRWRNRSADVATARAETYARPGALPLVKPAAIGEDLARRDFTINALAVELNPSRFGDLIDSYNGLNDIEKRLVRVLHNKSFIDDATRIWRAVRYEQRLDFKIEPATLALVKRDIGMLDTITGDRIRRELELVLLEENPEKPLQRADSLGILSRVSPSLRADDWLAKTFAITAEQALSGKIHPHLYLALLFLRTPPVETGKVIEYLHLPKAAAQILHDSAAIRAHAAELEITGLAPSRVYEILHGYSLVAIEANALGIHSEVAAEQIDLYINVLRHVNPVLTGEDLLELGVPQGPRIKEVITKLREARLDGQIDTKKDEIALLKSLLL